MMAASQISVLSVAEMPLLLLVEGDQQRSIALETFPFAIGRKTGNDLVLTDPRVSREHANIIQEHGAYYVVDRGSRHGTFVNGERVERRRLGRNDRLEFGSQGTVYAVFSPDRPPSSTARDFLSQAVGRTARSDLEMLAIFLEAARKLNSSGVLNDVLVTLVDTTLKLTRAERGYVFLRDREGSLRLAVAQNSQGQPLPDDSSISRSLLEEAAQSAKEFLVHDARESSQYAARGSIVSNQLRTIICIPLRHTQVGGRDGAGAATPASGVLYLDSRSVSSDISTTSHDMLRAVASEAATLLENAHLVEAAEESRKVQQELAIAAYIQQRLMAVVMPELDFAMVRARNVPCKDIGGDFYDVVNTSDGLAVVIADVCGKGISAALLASILQGMIYSQLCNNVPLAEVVASVNQFLCQKNLDAKYATLVLVRLAPNGMLEYVNCGHVPPLLLRQGNASRLKPTNVPVGLLPDAKYESARLQLEKGDRFIMVTDGATEARNPAGDFFGDDRLEEAVCAESPLEGLFSQMEQFRVSQPYDDDCTVVDVEFRG
jgi:serine phosphatase RsbU (regulator of sigma subunit)